MNSSTDHIERQVVLKAPRAKVWRALTNAEEFGNWFGVNFKGKSFAPGQRTQGQLSYPGYEHVVMEVLIDQIVPEKLFSWRWHPYAVKPEIDYSQEEATLVVFELKEVDGGTLLTVVESGFDKVPAARRDEAFRMNDGGWEQQMKRIEKHVSTS